MAHSLLKFSSERLVSVFIPFTVTASGKEWLTGHTFLGSKIPEFESHFSD